MSIISKPPIYICSVWQMANLDIKKLKSELPMTKDKWVNETARQYLSGILDQWEDIPSRRHFYENYLPWIMKRERWKSIIIAMVLKY